MSLGKNFEEDGISIGWSINIPTYRWCSYMPPADVWSHYTNYTLQDANQQRAQITQQFVFAQWQQAYCCNSRFTIGFSVSTHMYDPGPKIKVDGPGTGDNFATFIYWP